jgi:membrane-bound metal-dependent hydrolase YbcI (DUF457 family)
MASGKTHLAVGAAVGLTVALADQEKHEVSHHPGVGVALGAMFGKLPDILAPSIGNPHHRQFCHSILVLAALGVGLKRMYDWEPENKGQQCLRGVGLIAGCAYVSHLLCDAVTPRSLPLLGKI